MTDDLKFDEKVRGIIATYLKGNAFIDRKITDTPTGSDQVISRGYSQKNGAVANRPVSSVATVGQFYLATDTKIPMRYTTAGWVNGVGSIVALNN